MTKNNQLSTLRVAKVYLERNVVVGEEESEELIEVRRFETEPAEVGVNLGRTINMGDFNSVRIDVSVKIPCYAEEKDEVFQHLLTWAADRVNKEVDYVMATKAKKKGLFEL